METKDIKIGFELLKNMTIQEIIDMDKALGGEQDGEC